MIYFVFMRIQIMCDKTVVRLSLAAALLASAVSAQADVFNMGGTISGGTWTGLASLQFVSVGEPDNAADSTGFGSVSYAYQIGTYDVTVGQYCQFLNAVATKSDPYGLYDPAMATDLPTIAITQSGTAPNYRYTVTGSDSQGVNCPVFDVSWGDAARFCNWLQNGQPTSGTEAASTTETGAYALAGATSQAALMAVPAPSHSGAGAASYFIPSENELYKAAYYDPTLNSGAGGYWAYPTRSNIAPNNALVLAATSTNDDDYYTTCYADPTNYLTPVGTFVASPGAYGTYDVGGGVLQWDELNAGLYRGLGGGSWRYPGMLVSSDSTYSSPTFERDDIGFRVASSVAVPEPTSVALLLAGAVALGIWRLRRNGYGWRRRRATSPAKLTASVQDAPAILSFPSRSSAASAARHAA